MAHLRQGIWQACPVLSLSLSLCYLRHHGHSFQTYGEPPYILSLLSLLSHSLCSLEPTFTLCQSSWPTRHCSSLLSLSVCVCVCVCVPSLLCRFLFSPLASRTKTPPGLITICQRPHTHTHTQTYIYIRLSLSLIFFFHSQCVSF